MAANKKLRVAVLFGGKSSEHDISLISAASVIKHLDRERFDIVPVAIDKQGNWYQGLLSEHCVNASDTLVINDYKEIHLALPFLTHQANHHNYQSIDKAVDIVFPVMHGPFCEDGAIQGLLEIVNIPYVGSGVLASAVSMDKDVAKKLVGHANIPTAKHLTLKSNTTISQRKILCEQIKNTLNLPIFIKPANMGSSVGISKVNKFEQLLPAIQTAFRYDNKILIEEGIDGREIELAVLQNKDPYQPPLVSTPGEILVSKQHDYYSYEAKYHDDSLQLSVPAQLNSTQIKQCQALASNIFTALECEGMARIDLFLEKKTGRFLFNEVNTIPGFTSVSMYPLLWQASGLSYSDLLSYLIDLAIARYQRIQQISTGIFNAYSK